MQHLVTEGSHGVTEGQGGNNQLVGSVSKDDHFQETLKCENLKTSPSTNLNDLQGPSELETRKIILKKLNIGMSGCQVDVSHILAKDYLLLAKDVSQPSQEEVSQLNQGVSQLNSRHKSILQPVNECMSENLVKTNVKKLEMITFSGKSVLQYPDTLLLASIPRHMDKHYVMDLNLKLGKSTTNLINTMSDILNCGPNCFNFRINNETPSNAVTQTGMVQLGTLYFENKTFDFIKHFCTLFQANSFNSQLGYYHKLQIKGSNVKMGFEFTGLNNILKQMSNFAHLYKADVTPDIECNFSCDDVTHKKAFLLKKIFEKHRAGIIESIEITSRDKEINYRHEADHQDILGIDLHPKVMVLPDHLGEIAVDTDQSEMEEIVLEDNLVTIAFHEDKFFILVKQTSNDSCFKQLTKFRNNMKATTIFKKDINFDACKSQWVNSPSGSKQNKCILCKKDFQKQSLAKHLLIDHKILTLFEVGQQEKDEHGFDKDEPQHQVVKCANEGCTMSDVDFDMRVGKIPFSFHHLLQCAKAKPFEYLKKIKIMKVDIKSLLNIEEVNIGDILEQRGKLDCISMEGKDDTDSQCRDRNLIWSQMQQRPNYLAPELHNCNYVKVSRGHSRHIKPKSVKQSIIMQSEAKVTGCGNSSPDSIKISDKPENLEKVLFCDDLENLDHLDNLGGVNIKPGESEKFWSQLLGQETLPSSVVAERDYKICLGHPESKITTARRCTVPHDRMTYCPLQGSATEEQLGGLMHQDNDHTLGASCLISSLQDIQPSYHEYKKIDQFINVLFVGKSKMTRRKQNKEIDDDLKSEDIAPPLKSECLDPIIKQQVEGIINSYLAPPRDGTYRCASCRACSSCTPLSNLTRKQKLSLI